MEAGGVDDYSAVQWETTGADIAFLNGEVAPSNGEKWVFMNREECEKKGGVNATLMIQNKYGASASQNMVLKPSAPIMIQSIIHRSYKRGYDLVFLMEFSLYWFHFLKCCSSG